MYKINDPSGGWSNGTSAEFSLGSVRYTLALHYRPLTEQWYIDASINSEIVMRNKNIRVLGIARVAGLNIWIGGPRRAEIDWNVHSIYILTDAEYSAYRARERNVDQLLNTEVR